MQLKPLAISFALLAGAWASPTAVDAASQFDARAVDANVAQGFENARNQIQFLMNVVNDQATGEQAKFSGDARKTFTNAQFLANANTNQLVGYLNQMIFLLRA